MAGFLGRRSLEKRGVGAQARILEKLKLTSSSSPASTTSSGLYTGVRETWKVRIRVEPEADAPFELETKITFPLDNGPVRVGFVFPVLYDPEDHDRVMYDPEPLSDAQVAANIAEGTGLTERLPGLDVADLVTRWQEDPKAAREQVRAQFGSTPGAFVPGAVPAPPAEDPVDRLAKLADLRDRGALTDAEFEAQKARILGEG